MTRPDIKSTETVRNANGPRIGLEVLSLKNKYDHGGQRVALQLLHASDPRSDDLSNNKSENKLPDADLYEKTTKSILTNLIIGRS